MIEKKNIMDSYKFYKGIEEKPVTLSMYRAIVNGFVKFIVRKVFEGFDVQLSTKNSLGILCIRGKKHKVWFDEDGNIKGLSVDWGATNKLWKERPDLKEKKHLVYHMNEHTNGVRYSFKWFKDGAKLPNKFLYTFTAYRPTKRTLPKMVRQGREYLITE